MQHYSREHDRAQQQVLELERRKSMLEAALAAVETCWAQVSLISTARPSKTSGIYTLAASRRNQTTREGRFFTSYRWEHTRLYPSLNYLIRFC
jgi:nicotinic acid mononucleotide adenylyltransferase